MRTQQEITDENKVEDTEKASFSENEKEENAPPAEKKTQTAEDAGETLSPAEQERQKKDVIKKERKKKILLYSLLVVVNALVILMLLLIEDKSGDVAAGREAFGLLGKNLGFTLLAFSMFFVIAAFDSWVFYALTRRLGLRNCGGVSIKTALYGRYYDKITPWAMGGEPFQIGYLIQSGVDAGESAAITMSRHIIRFFTNAVTVIIILSASRVTTNIWVMLAAIFSVFVGLLLPVFMIICCFRPALGQRIGRGLITLLYKLKLVKNYDKQTEKMQSMIKEFLQGLIYLSKHKRLIILIALAALIELFAVNSVPFFVMRALGNQEIQYWNTLVLCIFVSYASSFAPTPGGAGLAELSFYAIFASVIQGGYLFWAVLFWRIAIFYLPIFMGIVLYAVDAVRAMCGGTKTKVQKK